MREAGETIGSHRGRRANAARLVLCALALAAALAVIPASSSTALSQRGHELVRTVGTEGSGAGEMKEPEGVAVNEATGNVYVVDHGNARVDVFDSEGNFKFAFGYGVKDGEHQPEVCTTETTCRAGLPAKVKGNLFNAREIAIDNSTDPKDPSKGDVYVEVPPFETGLKGKEIEREGTVEKFTSEGLPVEKGAVISSWKSEIVNKEGHVFFSKEEIEETFGMTVDAAGDLYLTNEETVIKWDNGSPNKQLHYVEAEGEGTEEAGLAVDSSGNLYLANAFPVANASQSQKYAPEYEEFLPTGGEPILETIFDKPSSAIAYDTKKNDFVIDNYTGISVLNHEKQLVETIGAGQMTKSKGVAVNAGSETIYASDEATGKLLMFGPEAPGAPTFGPSSTQNTTGTSTEISAGVDPTGGQQAEYSIRASSGPVPDAGSPCTSPCVESTLTPLGSEGFEEVKVGPLKLEGLTPETKYHYRVFAQNKVGAATLTAESGEFFFTTTYAPGSTLPDGRAWQQVSPVNKNGSALQPNPVDGALGGDMQAAASGEAITYLGAGAISNCEGNPEPEGNYAPVLTQIYGHWSPQGWCSHDLDIPHEAAEGVIPGEGNGYQLFSEDGSHALLQPITKAQFEQPPLNGLEGQERTPYVRSQEPECLASPAPKTCFNAMANASNTTHPFAEPNSNVVFAGGNASLSNVVVEATKALTGTPVPSRGNLYERTTAAPGTLALVSVLPNEAAAANAVLGSGPTRTVEHAVSETGSHVFFEGSEEAKSPSQHLYMRDTSLGKTIQIDTQQPGVTIPAGLYLQPPATYEVANYLTASADGSMVYFTDQWRLTPDSQAGPGQFDLYACHIEVVEGAPKCALKDLTVSANAEERAGVQGILGAGSTSGGSSIYYVANGQLAPGAVPAKCVPGQAASEKEGEEAEEGVELEAKAIGRLCNLYVQRYDATSKTWGKPKLIGRVSAEDESDWHSQLAGNALGTRGPMGSITSRVSPNGEFAAFMSDQNLTGYDTRDVSNGRGAEEVYTYSGGSGKLACVSCNRSGSRPHATFDTIFSGEGIGFQWDRTKIWRDRLVSANVPGWSNYNLVAAQYQSRYMDDQGRVFFNSVEALVPQDTNGKADVYEWEPTGVGGCTPAAETYSEAFSEGAGGCISLISSGKSDRPSVFIDASANGNDVFFLTSGQLVKQDQDSSFDVYDASVCGREGMRPCLPEPEATKPPCTEIKTCRPEEGEVSSTPTFAPPLTAAAGAPGNTGKSEVLPNKEEKPASKPTTTKAKPLTRAQKLAKALKACKKLKSHSKRVACEKAARKKYAAKKSSAHKSATHHVTGKGR